MSDFGRSISSPGFRVCCLAALIAAVCGCPPPMFQPAPSSPFAVGNAPFSVAVADLDDDTLPDLVTANADSDDVSVLLGNGDGTFQPAPSSPFAVGDDPLSVAVADLDGDTIPDLVTANLASDDVSVLLGNGDGTFQAATSFAVGTSPGSVAVADLDGDTLPDLVTANVDSPPSRWATIPCPWRWPTSTATPSPTSSPPTPPATT
jgi:hypothetical protein